MTRFATVLVLLGVLGCQDPGPDRVTDVAPTPEGMICEPASNQPCVERPAMALAMAGREPSDAHALYVAGDTGELFRVAPDGDDARTDALGFMRGDAFSELDRWMPCDVLGDGQPWILYSPIDQLDGGYLVFAPIGGGEVFGKRPTQRDHQAARCIDIDGDGREDVVGLVSATELGVAYGQSWGLPDGIGRFTVPSLSTDPDDPDYLWKVVTSAAGDLDLDGQVEWIWTVRGRSLVRIWSVDPTLTAVTEHPPIEADVSIDRIDLADLDGDGAPDLVLSGSRNQDTGAISVLLGDGDGGFSTTATLALSEPIRRISSADIDDDGDDEVIAVGGWVEGVVVVDYADDELEIIASFPALANDAVALRFDDDATWDLAILHADTWHVEILRDAFAPARD